MIHRIPRHLDAQLVVFHDLELESGSIRGSIQNLTQQAMYPVALLNHQN